MSNQAVPLAWALGVKSRSPIAQVTGSAYTLCRMQQRVPAGDIQEALEDFLQSSATCLLLVHRDASRLEHVADAVLSTYDWPRVSVGRELSAALLPELVRHRSRAARQWVAERCTSLAPGPILLTEIDLLFAPSLQLDPLSLLTSVSRSCRLVVAWPGEYTGETLTYAVPEHRHYRAWRRPQAAIMAL